MLTSELTANSAYVQQEDIFIGTMTVKEQLFFQAALRMDKHLSKKERKKQVERVLVDVSLIQSGLHAKQ